MQAGKMQAGKMQAGKMQAGKVQAGKLARMGHLSLFPKTSRRSSNEFITTLTELKAMRAPAVLGVRVNP